MIYNWTIYATITYLEIHPGDGTNPRCDATRMYARCTVYLFCWLMAFGGVTLYLRSKEFHRLVRFRDAWVIPWMWMWRYVSSLCQRNCRCQSQQLTLQNKHLALVAKTWLSNGSRTGELISSVYMSEITGLCHMMFSHCLWYLPHNEVANSSSVNRKLQVTIIYVQLLIT